MGYSKESGLTLIELIIVLAIIAIIGGIIAPNFVTTTDRARLRSDVQSAQVIQSAVELYQAETGSIEALGGDVDNILETLITDGYLKEGNWATQSGGDWVWSDNRIKLSVGSSENLLKIAQQLTLQEKAFIQELEP